MPPLVLFQMQRFFNAGVQELKAGQQGEAILDHTPFYADAGGQVGDRGWLYSDDHNTVVAEVTGCYYPVQGVRAHQVVMKSAIRVADKVDAVVNTDIRESTMRNHTATHLLHAALRDVLGKHVKQAGSLVSPGHLRFENFGRAWVSSSPVIWKCRISAMLVAWSPIRSRFLAMNSRCAPGATVSGSLAISVRSSRKMLS